MITKPELLRQVKDIIISEGYGMPLYLGHLLQTLPWYGLPMATERHVRQILEKIRLETEESRQNTEMLYQTIQERNHPEY